MKIFKEIEAIREYLNQVRTEGKTIGLVPTMGALHEGHFKLISEAGQLCDVVVCSIFVNPTQFNNEEDLKNYPRDMDNDLEQLRSLGCEVSFCPSSEEMYAGGGHTKFNFGKLSNTMEGEFRPGHFGGVGLVVSKLLNIIQPEKALFGQKDLQQYVIIREMVNDLNMDVEIVAVPTVREANGLAMSSRNRRLSPEQIETATGLFRALQLVQGAVTAGTEGGLKLEAQAFLDSLPAIDLEYLEVVNLDTWQVVSEIEHGHNYAVCISAYIGGVRLIDNILLEGNVDRSIKVENS